MGRDVAHALAVTRARALVAVLVVMAGVLVASASATDAPDYSGHRAPTSQPTPTSSG